MSRAFGVACSSFLLVSSVAYGQDHVPRFLVDTEAISEELQYRKELESAYEKYVGGVELREYHAKRELDRPVQPNEPRKAFLEAQVRQAQLEIRQTGRNYPQKTAGVGVGMIPRFLLEIIESEDEDRFAKPSDPNPTDEFAAIRVFLATNRMRSPEEPRKPSEFFSTRRAQNLTFASADITMPLDHARGRLEEPLALWKFRLPWRKKKHITFINIEPLSADEFSRALKAETRRLEANSVFLFIHGYNTPFAQCVRRAAQLGYDLTFTRKKGGALLAAFCWPSVGEEASYRIDEGNAEASIHHLEHFLKVLTREFKGKRLYVIAHSMGTRPLAAAFRNLVQSGPAQVSMPFFREIVLAAPDIDREVFVNQVGPTITMARRKGGWPRVTLYASDGDLALKASAKYGGDYPRAGQAGTRIIAMDGLDTVDASKVDTSFLGHSYFGDNRSVISDVIQLFWNDLPPEKRSELRKSRSGAHYEFVR